MNIKNLCITFLLFISVSGFGQKTGISHLRTERQSEPLGMDTPNPEFSWAIESDERGLTQTAYEIQVSTDEKVLQSDKGNVWQSGKVPGSATFGSLYNGKTLKPFTRYFWKIRIWDQNGKVSDWSQPAWFETAMLNASEWKAQWISDNKPLPAKNEDFYKEHPNPLLRRTFNLKKEISTARLYIAGLGYAVTYMNGQRVGDHKLDMPWTQFGKQVLYSTYDVTKLLNKGTNAIGVMLGNGWYNPMPINMFQRWNFRDYLTVGKPCVKAQLRIVYTDGSVETIVTDQSWKAGEGPVLMNSVYLGETYDARLEQRGWSEPGFDESR